MVMAVVPNAVLQLACVSFLCLVAEAKLVALPAPAYNSTYEPSDIVLISESLNIFRQPVDWLGLVSSSSSAAYVVNAQFAVVPIILLSLGLLSCLVLFGIKVLAPLFCNCECTCKPKVVPSTDLEYIQQTLERHRRRSSALLYLLCLLQLAAAQLVIYERQNLITGMAGIASFATSFSNLFSSATTTANSIASSATNMTSAIADSPACLSSLATTAASFKEQALSFQSDLSSLSSSLTSIGTLLGSYLGDDLRFELVLFSCYALPVIAAVCLTVSNFFRSKIAARFSLAWSGITFFFALLLGFFFLTLTIVMADLCVDPMGFVLAASPSSLAHTLRYYTSCVKTNPLFSSTTTARQNLATLDSTLTSLASTAACSNNAYYYQVKQQVALAGLEVTSAENAVNCPVIAKLLHSTLEQTVCVNVFSFVASIAVTMQGTSFFMFVLLLVGATTSAYYKIDDVNRLAASNVIIDENSILQIVDKESAEQYRPPEEAF